MKKINIEPIGENILILPDNTEITSESGILIAVDEDAEKPQLGEILAVGEDVKNTKLIIGNRVIFRKYGGTEVIDDGIIYLIMTPSDILALDKR